MEPRLLSEMSWLEVERLLRFDQRLIVVAGASEQHGRHLPHGTDTLIPWELARRLSEVTGVVVAPPITIGMSELHMGFAGTLTLTQETLQAVYLEIIQSAYRQGWRQFFVLNGHGGNRKAWEWVMTLAPKVKPDLKIQYTAWWQEPEVLALSREVYGRTEGHAGLEETAAVLAIAPELVRLGAAQATPDSAPDADTPAAYQAAVPHGAIGVRPGEATAEHGERILAALVAKYGTMLGAW
jgi:creatinine amidohydrolase